MTDVLDVVGLIALIVAAFLVALWVGFAVLGVSCLLASYSVTRRARIAAERKVDRGRLVRAA